MNKYINFINNNKKYLRYLVILLIIIVISFDFFVVRPENITGFKIKFFWGSIIFTSSFLLILLFKIVSVIFFKKEA